MQDKMIILECPECKNRIPIKTSDFMQHLKGVENEYLCVFRKCMNCEAELEFVCKAVFFVKSLSSNGFKARIYNKRK